jgi:stress response protein YsnF/sporulation protein YlmC with PRC-barrel domain
MSAEGVFNEPSSLTGRSMYDTDGDKIGSVGQVYVGDRTGRPEWVTVKTGLFGMKESLVPLSGARRAGEDIHVPYAKETVKEAPRLDADEHLDPGQEKQLYRHYGLTSTGGIGTAAATGTAGGTGTAAATGTGKRTGAGSGRPAEEGMSTGRAGMAGEIGDPAMAGSATRGAGLGEPRTGETHGEELIRSEEQLRVTAEEREVGHARLRKVVVTENVTTSVPLSHEEVRVVHEAIAPEDRSGLRDSRIGEAQTEVTLHAEQPITSKESIPVERVRMETEKVTEQKEVSAEVRKEQIEYDTDQDDKGYRAGQRGPGR